MKWTASSRPCLFSFSNIRTLKIALPDDSGTVPPHIYQYFALSASALKDLSVNHSTTSLLDASSRTLNISGIKVIRVGIRRDHLNYGLVFRLFEWWISNFSAVDEHCAIHSISFFVNLYLRESQEGSPASDWEDLCTRLDDCLASYKMTSLEHVDIHFVARPPESNALKAGIELKNFPKLQRLGRKVVLRVEDTY
ncbi:hypothetical protein EV421DRAFT_1910886 [Armillaria borealis]|uniref:Uncharacterized protein n=1 Tax=Armillaria borealis TaxID=47425 RepID=A0AA39IZ71_9AGAR|nr:hypothetical protein EV421DRAFT_1910886 [Armillaria borealis]